MFENKIAHPARDMVAGKKVEIVNKTTTLAQIQVYM